MTVWYPILPQFHHQEVYFCHMTGAGLQSMLEHHWQFHALLSLILMLTHLLLQRPSGFLVQCTLTAAQPLLLCLNFLRLHYIWLLWLLSLFFSMIMRTTAALATSGLMMRNYHWMCSMVNQGATPLRYLLSVSLPFNYVFGTRPHFSLVLDRV